MGGEVCLPVDKLSYFQSMHWITIDQPLFKGRPANKWALAIIAKSNFFVLLLDPTFQMNRTHRIIVGFCGNEEGMKRVEIL